MAIKTGPEGPFDFGLTFTHNFRFTILSLSSVSELQQEIDDSPKSGNFWRA